MRLYLTKLVKTDNFNRVFSFTGPDIIAENDAHALLALAHHNLANYTLVTYIPIERDETLRPVQWDSLIYPSELQKN